MIPKDEAIKKGVTIIDSKQSHNQLLETLKANFPETIKDNQVDLKAIATLLGLNDKADIQGYELTFTGKGLANALYSTPTQKLLTFETSFMPPHSTESVIARQSQSDNEAIQNIESTCHTEPLGEVSKSLESSRQTPQNFIIRGDNLDALKILKSAYTDKIKMIYIDPPYNTKNENFIYPDNFRKDYQAILQEVGLLEIDENGEEKESETLKFFRNIHGSRTHSGWLAFMLPRLKLARDLLKDDGVIFISIDDNEQANLKILCDEIFGEENFVADSIWNNKYTTSNDTDISYQHEHILIYSKDRNNFKLGLLPRTEKQDKSYKNRDNDPKGAWKPTPIHARSGSANNLYKVTFPNGVEWEAPIGRYPRYSKENLLQFYKNGELYFNANGGIDKKTYLREVRQGITCGTLWNYEEVGHTHGNNEEIAEILGKGIFSDPKGTKLLKKIIQISTTANMDSRAEAVEMRKQGIPLGEADVSSVNRGFQGGGEGSLLDANDRADNAESAIYRSNATPDIVLDFFAGSGTTAHAIMELNKEDGGNRQFILVQIDEPINEEKSKTAYDFCKNELQSQNPVISDITIERVKRASTKIANENFSGFSVLSLSDKPELITDEKGALKLLDSTISPRDKALNLALQSGKPLDKPLESIFENKLYKCEDCLYVIVCDKEVLEYLRNTQNEYIFIDAFSDISLENFLNLDSSLNERLRVVY